MGGYSSITSMISAHLAGIISRAEAPYRANLNLSHSICATTKGQEAKNVPFLARDFSNPITARNSHTLQTCIAPHRSSARCPRFISLNSDRGRSHSKMFSSNHAPKGFSYTWVCLIYRRQKAAQGVPAAFFSRTFHSLRFFLISCGALRNSWTFALQRPAESLLSAVFGALAPCGCVACNRPLHMPPYMVQMENRMLHPDWACNCSRPGPEIQFLIVALPKRTIRPRMSLVVRPFGGELRFRPLMYGALPFISVRAAWIASVHASVAHIYRNDRIRMHSGGDVFAAGLFRDPLQSLRNSQALEKRKHCALYRLRRRAPAGGLNYEDTALLEI